MTVAEWLRDVITHRFAARYGSRRDTFVHVHELLHPAAMLPSLRRMERSDERLGYLFVGEVFETGLREVLGAYEPPRVVERIIVPAAHVGATVLAALKEAGVAVRHVGDKVSIMIDGQTDLSVASDPDGVRLWEVKTTRTSRDREYKRKWRIQAAIYAWLYREPVRLVVFNLNEGRLEPETEVFEPDGRWFGCYISHWLKGTMFPWTRCGRLPRAGEG